MATILTRVLATLDSRRKVYLSKAAAADPLGPETDTAYDRYAFGAEAVEHDMIAVSCLDRGDHLKTGDKL